MTVSSTAGESLIDKLGEDAPPIGLIHTAYGGSQIEAVRAGTHHESCSCCPIVSVFIANRGCF